MSIRLVPIRVFFVHVILFTGLFLACFIAEAQLKVVSTLACEQVQNINSPDFIQGSEKYFDLRYTADQKVQVTYSQATISNGALFAADETVSSIWDPMGGRVFAKWKSNAYVTLMEFSGEWKGYLMFPSDSDPRANPFGVPEIEIRCGIMRW